MCYAAYMSNRVTELLVAAADAFLDGSNPFADNWLAENEVTFNECMDLSDAIGVILKGYCAASPEVRRSLLIGGALRTGVPLSLVDEDGLGELVDPGL